MIGPTAPDSAKMMPNATGVSRPAIAIPATAASPYPATIRVTTACPTGVASCVRMAGPEIANKGAAAATTLAPDGRPNPP